jgi:hypothetical protein
MASLSGISSTEKTHALCIIPPPTVVEVLDEIRIHFDKASNKWPCHVRVAYLNPMIGDRNVKERMAAEMSLMPSFTIKLAAPQFGACGSLSKAKDGRVYITSECVASWVAHIDHAPLPARSPEQHIGDILVKYGMSPQEHINLKWHLSLAQMPNVSEAAKFREALTDGWSDIKWRCGEFTLLQQTAQQQYKDTFKFPLLQEEEVDINEAVTIVSVWRHLSRLCQECIQEGDFSKAMAYAKHCQRVAPHRAIASFLVGEVYEATNQVEKSRESYVNAKLLAEAYGATPLLLSKIKQRLDSNNGQEETQFS